MFKVSKVMSAALASGALLAMPALADGEGQGVYVSNPDRNGVNINLAQAEFERLKNRIAEFEFDEWCSFNGFTTNPTGHDRRHVYPCRVAPGFTAVFKANGNEIEIYSAEPDTRTKLRAVVFDSADKERLADIDAIRDAFEITSIR
jgi:hypothetical protein